MANGPLVVGDTEVRRAITAQLADGSQWMRQAVAKALAPLVASDAASRQTITAQLADGDNDVRRMAVWALTPLAINDTEVRQAIAAQLTCADNDVRSAAVAALAPLVTSDAAARQAVTAKLDDGNEWVRSAAVQALAPLVSSDAAARQAVTAQLADGFYDVRQAAVEALAPLVSSDTAARQAVTAQLDDGDYHVRWAAVEALAPLVSSDAVARQAVIAKLADGDWQVRMATVAALAPLVASDQVMRDHLLLWLAFVIERPWEDSGEAIRRSLADAYAPLLAAEPALLAQMAAMLDSVAWPARQGAAWALIAMPGGPPPELLPKLRGLLNDMRGEESWPNRLQVAELLINNQNRDLSHRAIAVAVEALDYATQPWYYLPQQGPAVRRQAAAILGKLEPLYRDEAVFARLARVLNEDNDAQVRDAAYAALLRLAAAPEERTSGE